jgi:hypothetical protein
MSDTTDNGGAIEPTSVQTGAEAAQGGSQPPATTGDNTPARPTFGGLISGIINFVFLAGCFIALAAAAMWLKEKLHLLKERMRQDAALARRVAELCGQAGVDPYFLALFIETSQAFDRVADASGELADAADQMEMNARFVKDAHDTEYRGIYEATNASPYAQPKPGFNAVR